MVLGVSKDMISVNLCTNNGDCVCLKHANEYCINSLTRYPGSQDVYIDKCISKQAIAQRCIPCNGIR